MARRSLTAAIMAGVVAITSSMLLALTPTRAQGTPTRPVDTAIQSYVIFGSQTVEIKGSDIPNRGFIRGGNVGANGIDAQLRGLGFLSALDATVNICANKHITMSDGSQVVGDTVRFSSNCTFWDVFTNNLIGSGGGVAHSITQPVGPFPLITEPVFPDFACNPANPVTVPKGSPPSALSPGDYGAVEFQDATTVTLTTGIYRMCNLHLGQDVHFIAGRGTILQITGELNIGNGSHFAMEEPCSTFVYVRGDGVTLNDASINFGKNTEAAGHFRTLGKINLGNGTNLFGTFWGGSVISDFDIDVTFCPLTGDFPLAKSIAGPGAGLQGEIRIDITCLPNPPNTTPIPPFIIPAGATGTVTTLVTDITLPAKCTLTETNNGDNDLVDVVTPGLLAAPAPPASDVDLCPDVGAAPTRTPLAAPRAVLPLSQLNNVFDTTTTTTTTTTSEPTTTTTTTTAPTSSIPGTSTPETIPPCVLPPDLTSLPSVPDGGSTLPATGHSRSETTTLLIAMIAASVGLILVLVARRREREGPQPN